MIFTNRKVLAVVLPGTMLFTLAVSSQRCAAETPVAVGLQKQLLVDDYVVADKSNISRELQTMVKANGGKPVLQADQPWESDNILIGSVFREGGKFKMFYKVGYADPEPNDPPGIQQLCVAYAESSDGLHWSKPHLGIRTFQGRKQNNLINPMGLTCLPDPHETDPEHKYKAAYSHWQKMMAAIAHSPDGLHWTPYNDGNPVTSRAADTINQLLWDPYAKTYRLYTRTDYQSKLKAKIEVRGTRDMVNPDIAADPKAWTNVREWNLDREGSEEHKRRQIYSLNGWIYEGIQFGLVWSLEWPDDLSEGPTDLVKRHERDIMNAYLLTARGDDMWDLTSVYENKPLIPRGGDSAFDKDWVQPAVNIVTWKDQHWLYYSGAKERHGASNRGPVAIGLATLPLDRFVAMHAESNGTVTTKPFEFVGHKLQFNASTAPDGGVWLELLDQDGQVIKGYKHSDRFVGDKLKQLVAFGGSEDLSTLRGKNVAVRFHLNKAKLYSFAVLPEPPSAAE